MFTVNCFTRTCRSVETDLGGFSSHRESPEAGEVPRTKLGPKAHTGIIGRTKFSVFSCFNVIQLGNKSHFIISVSIEVDNLLCTTLAMYRNVTLPDWTALCRQSTLQLSTLFYGWNSSDARLWQVCDLMCSPPDGTEINWYATKVIPLSYKE